MKHYSIHDKYIALSASSSKGTQIKYFKNNNWYKIDNVGGEGLAEEITSKLLQCSNHADYVVYEKCVINGKNGCKSANFLGDGEELVSFSKLYEYNVGGSLTDKIFALYDTKDRYKYLVDFISDTTGLDIREYLGDIFALDMIIKNPDRHFGNLAVIMNRTTGKFREAPIFDNGQGLLQNYNICSPAEPLDIRMQAFHSATISGSFEQQYSAAGKTNLRIDKKRFKRILSHYKCKDIVEFLERQMEEYKFIFY